MLSCPPLPLTRTRFGGGALGAVRGGRLGRGGNGGLREEDAAGVTRLVPPADKTQEAIEDTAVRLLTGGRAEEAEMCVVVFLLTAASGGDPSAEDRLPERATGAPEHVVIEGIDSGT